MGKLPSIKKKWPADQVERRKVKDLAPYAKNARTRAKASCRREKTLALWAPGPVYATWVGVTPRRDRR